MTRLILLTSLLATLATLTAATTTTANVESIPETTPSPVLEPADEAAHLALRQIAPGGGAAGAVPTVAVQAPAITVYQINTGVGAAAAQVAVTYTQLFSPVPDQWPAAQSGAIGYGTLQKRTVEARATGPDTVVNTVWQPVVLVMATEVVVRSLRRVTQVLVVATMTVSSNHTVMNEGGPTGNDSARVGNDTLRAGNNTTRPLLRGSGGTGAVFVARTASR